MIRNEDFRGRRTPDVYTRRNGKLEKINEKKPNSELIDRLDCVISKLDKITGAVEKLVSNCNIKIDTDVNELNQKISEKYNDEESNEEKRQSGEYVKDDLFTMLNIINSRKSDGDCDKTDKDKSTAGNNDWLDGIADAALKVDWESFFDDNPLSKFKRTVLYTLNKEQDEKIMDELSSNDSIDNKPLHSDDLDTSSLELNNLLFEKDCISETMKRMCPGDYDDALDLYKELKLCLNKIWSKESNDKKPKKTIFCILGESGSGKDTLVEYTLKEFKLKLKPVLSYTDRPMRDGEQNGKEHIFLSKDEMTEFLKSNKKDIAAYTQIGETGYRYCAMISVIDRSDIYIIDPNGLKEFKEITGDRYNIVSIYIDCPLKERRKRTEKRGDSVDKFEARVAAESDQFAKFREEHGYDHVIDNGSMSTIYHSSMVLFDIFRYYRKDIRDVR